MEKNNEVKRTQGEWLTSGKGTKSDKRAIWSMQTHRRVLICTLDNTMYQSESNAEFICKAVNEYDKLKADNEVLLNALKVCGKMLDEKKRKVNARLTSYEWEIYSTVLKAIKQVESK